MQYSPFLKDMWQRTMKRLEETDRTLQILSRKTYKGSSEFALVAQYQFPINRVNLKG